MALYRCMGNNKKELTFWGAKSGKTTSSTPYTQDVEIGDVIVVFVSRDDLNGSAWTITGMEKIYAYYDSANSRIWGVYRATSKTISIVNTAHSASTESTVGTLRFTNVKSVVKNDVAGGGTLSFEKGKMYMYILHSSGTTELTSNTTNLNNCASLVEYSAGMTRTDLLYTNSAVEIMKKINDDSSIYTNPHGTTYMIWSLE